MAPRKRAQQERKKKMDVALAALRPMFPDNVIRKTINHLLKVIGKDEVLKQDGWSFIEADGYELVFDTIYQEQRDAEKKNLEGNCSQNNDNPNVEHGTKASPSRVDSLQDENMEDEPRSQHLSSPIHSTQNDNMEDECQTEQPCSKSPVRSMQNHYTTPVHSAPITCPPLETDIVPFTTKNEPTSHDLTGRQHPSPQASSAGVPMLSPSPSPSPVNSHVRTKKLCYGWISSDEEEEEEEEELVYLTPAISRFH